MTTRNDYDHERDFRQPLSLARGVIGALRSKLCACSGGGGYWALRSKPYALFAIGLAFTFPAKAAARFSSSAEVATGYEYNSNIFFVEDGPDDFIYFLNPTLRILWEPGLGASAFGASISSPLQVYTQNTSETNFGDNILFNMGFDHQVSPRLSFNFQNDFQRVGRTRTGINPVTSGVPNQGPGTPTSPVFEGETELTTRGEYLTNIFSARVEYDYARNITITGGYSGEAQIYVDEGGNSSSHNVGGRVTYQLNDKWSFPFGYRFQIINSRNGDQDIVHNVDFGGTYQDEILPTLTVFLSTGLGIRSKDSGGPSVVNNINFRLQKLWETSQGQMGVTRGLTTSQGVSGPSTTTTVFGDYSIQLARDWTAFTGVRASFYETDQTNYNTVQAQTGVQYRITSWLFSSLRYLFRMRDAGAGAENTELGSSGQIQSHSILLSFSTDFDLWPHFGLAHGEGMAEDGRFR